MSRLKEAGGVVTFVVVGALLAVALIGAIITVRNMKSPSQAQPSDDSKQTKVDSPTEQAQKDNDQALKTALESQSKDKDKTAETSKSSDKANANATPSTAQAGANDDKSADNLPHTGPGSTALSIAGATLLAGASIALIRSQRLI
ncbi:MAG: LPXTG cell wall anchor domain-containing protein [Candidatus Saccharimonas sp.]